MSLPNPFPLNIAEKQDTFEKLQLMANVPDEFKYLAGDFNKFLAGLNWMYENMPAMAGTVVEKRYANIGELLSDQAEQSPGKFMFVTDASADPEVTTGYAYYEKLAASTGNISNYNRIALKFIRPNPADNNRMEWYNGTEWKKLAYEDEIDLQGVTDKGNETTNDVTIQDDDKGFILKNAAGIILGYFKILFGGITTLRLESPAAFGNPFVEIESGSIKLFNGQALTRLNAKSNISTATAIPLNNVLGNYSSTPGWNATYTFTDAVPGGNATLLIDTTGQTAFPAVTGATLVSGSEFEADKIYEMHVYSLDGVTVDYFFLIKGNA